MSLKYAFIDWTDTANPRVRKFLEYTIGNEPQGIALQNGYPVLLPSTVDEVPEYDPATQARSRTETITGTAHSIVWTVRALTAEELEARAEQERQSIEQQLPDAAIKRMLRQSIDPETITSEEMSELVSVYPQWRPTTPYIVGQVLGYGEAQLIRIIQAHTSQADWLPEITPALYQMLAVDTGGTYPAWQDWAGQPENLYALGDRVTHNGQDWESTLDGNHWEPGSDTGWEETP